MKTISLTEFKKALQSEGNNSKVIFIDVRMPIEYKEKHIAGVQNIPLDAISEQIESLSKYNTIYMHCNSGTRCAKAISALAGNLPAKSQLIQFEGGIDAWETSGLPLEKKLASKLPIMRQVMITAGSLIIIGALLALFVDYTAIYLVLFVGSGLLLSGFTGWCGMAKFLSLMPWNQARK